jgi:hypothetical protein
MLQIGVPVKRAQSRERLREILSMCLLDPWAWEMMADGSYRRPATRTDEATKSSVLLGEKPYGKEQLEVLRKQGTQNVLMWSILQKIQLHNTSGDRVF